MLRTLSTFKGNVDMYNSACTLNMLVQGHHQPPPLGLLHFQRLWMVLQVRACWALGCSPTGHGSSQTIALLLLQLTSVAVPRWPRHHGYPSQGSPAMTWGTCSPCSAFHNRRYYFCHFLSLYKGLRSWILDRRMTYHWVQPSPEQKGGYQHLEVCSACQASA